MKASVVTGLVMNVPQWFEDPRFAAWLNDSSRRLMTWHRAGTPADEWSDTIVLVDPGLSGEGTDGDMPDPFWSEIVAMCRRNGLGGQPEHIPVRLTNLED